MPSSTRCEAWFDLATKPRQSLEAFFALVKDDRRHSIRCPEYTPDRSGTESELSRRKTTSSPGYRHIRLVLPDPILERQNPDTSLPSIEQVQAPTLDDALSFLDRIKMELDGDEFNLFLDTLADFKSGSIDTPGVIERVTPLFRNHVGLITEFNTFLPNGYVLSVEADQRIRCVTPMGTEVIYGE